MQAFSTWFTILLCTAICLSCSAMEIPQFWKNYLKTVTKRFEDGEIETEFKVIIARRHRISEQPSASMYTLPNVFVWDPLLQYDDVFSCFPFTCPLHNEFVLIPKQWTDGSTNARNPRIILNENGPCLLISRNYYCNSAETRHYVRGTDGNLIKMIGELISMPFRLTRKYAITNNFVQNLRRAVSNGVSFHHIQADYLQLQLQECVLRKEQFIWHKNLWERTRLLGVPAATTQDVTEFDEEPWNTFKEMLINICPSDDLLCDVFLKDFNERKILYEEAMKTIPAKSLMADHTFKVGFFQIFLVCLTQIFCSNVLWSDKYMKRIKK